MLWPMKTKEVSANLYSVFTLQHECQLLGLLNIWLDAFYLLKLQISNIWNDGNDGERKSKA